MRLVGGATGLTCVRGCELGANVPAVEVCVRVFAFNRSHNNNSGGGDDNNASNPDRAQKANAKRLSDLP